MEQEEKKRERKGKSNGMGEEDFCVKIGPPFFHIYEK